MYGCLIIHSLSVEAPFPRSSVGAQFVSSLPASSISLSEITFGNVRQAPRNSMHPLQTFPLLLDHRNETISLSP